MGEDGTNGREPGRKAAEAGESAAAGAPQADPRKARLAAALRENLRRRKAQARERRGSGGT
ncbi:MAG: hypothetical protein U1E62_13955 [Alsobacter sp.]